MTPEQWQRVDAILREAIDLDATARAAYLDQACGGDAALRQEVESLLGYDTEAATVIASAVQTAASLQANDYGMKEGDRIGVYRVVREIGRGGMGTVYLADRDDDHFLKEVAIKVVTHGMHTPAMLEHFRHERQILAGLEHPYIARLLDGGNTEDGRPFLVMEYVEGEPLVDFARKRNLSIADRLKLFVQLCSAVHHAHRMLVIHRDIKPSNVLVTEARVPKLLDFGIAKLVFEGPATERATVTATVMRRMTPQYASPEQIRGEPLTTATDVYSLGVLLYELLVFESPYRLTGRTSHEIERAICETGPLKLSSRVKGNPKVRRQLSGDLETIVSMALRKEPERRYASVQQLSDDVQNHLDGFPVTARGDTLLYVAGKFMRRNRLATAAFALLAFSVAGGWMATVRQGHRTAERYAQVRKLANSLLFDLSRSIQELPGSTPARQQLVTTGLEYLNSLSKDSGDDESLQMDLSRAYELMGDVQGDPLGANLGQFRPALTSYRKALELLEAVIARGSDTAVLGRATLLHLKCGDLESRTETLDAAMKSYQRGLAIAKGLESGGHSSDALLWQAYQRIAAAYEQMGVLAAAEQNARLAVEAAGRHAIQSPGREAGIALARTRTKLGDILWLRGDLNGAQAVYAVSVKWWEDSLAEHAGQPEEMEQLQIAYRRTGDLLGNPSFFHLGEPQQAKIYHTKSLRLAEQLAGRDSRNARAQAILYDEVRRLGAVMRETEPANSLALYERSIVGLERLHAESPDDLGYRRELANSRLGYAHALAALGRNQLAMAQLNLSNALYRELLKRDPDRQAAQEDLSENLVGMGRVQSALGYYEAAGRSLSEAIGIAQGLLRAKTGLYQERCLALGEFAMGDLHALQASRSTGAEVAAHRTEASSHYASALAIWSRWRSEKLAIPYSDREEQAVLRAKLASEAGRQPAAETGRDPNPERK